MKKKPKLTGEVVALTGAYTGQFIVQLYRYPSGRLLPEQRLLLDHGKPYTSRLAALDDLGLWNANRLVVGKREPITAKPAPVAAPKPVAKAPRKPRKGSRADIVARLGALDLTAFDAPAPLPAITKMVISADATVPAKARARLAAQQATAILIRKAQRKGVKVQKFGKPAFTAGTRPRRTLRASMVFGLQG